MSSLLDLSAELRIRTYHFIIEEAIADFDEYGAHLIHPATRIRCLLPVASESDCWLRRRRKQAASIFPLIRAFALVSKTTRYEFHYELFKLCGVSTEEHWDLSLTTGFLHSLDPFHLRLLKLIYIKMFGDSYQNSVGLCPTLADLKRHIPVTWMNSEVRVTINHRIAICPHHGAEHSQQVADSLFETTSEEAAPSLAIEVEDTFTPCLGAEWKLLER